MVPIDEDHLNMNTCDHDWMSAETMNKDLDFSRTSVIKLVGIQYQILKYTKYV